VLDNFQGKVGPEGYSKRRAEMLHRLYKQATTTQEPVAVARHKTLWVFVRI
jgi:hypothetical protein